jgi:hypothetical protein
LSHANTYTYYIYMHTYTWLRLVSLVFMILSLKQCLWALRGRSAVLHAATIRLPGCAGATTYGSIEDCIWSFVEWRSCQRHSDFNEIRSRSSDLAVSISAILISFAEKLRFGQKMGRCSEEKPNSRESYSECTITHSEQTARISSHFGEWILVSFHYIEIIEAAIKPDPSSRISPR